MVSWATSRRGSAPVVSVIVVTVIISGVVSGGRAVRPDICPVVVVAGVDDGSVVTAVVLIATWPRGTLSIWVG